MVGHRDSSNRIISAIYSQNPRYIIYFTRPTGIFRWMKEDKLQLEFNDELIICVVDAEVLRAKIDALMPRYGHRHRVIRSQMVGAYELAFNGRKMESNALLLEALARLVKAQTDVGQFRYFAANAFGCGMLWVAYWLFHFYLKSPPAMLIHWFGPFSLRYICEPWLLAGALGSAGGLLSVAINLQKVPVNINQGLFLHLFVGSTRSLVSFLAGIVCLVIIRAKVALAPAADVNGAFGAIDLQGLEVFFCILAGFSETLVTNILRKSEDEASGGDEATKARAAADKAREEAAAKKPDTENRPEVAAGSSSSSSSSDSSSSESSASQ